MPRQRQSVPSSPALLAATDAPRDGPTPGVPRVLIVEDEEDAGALVRAMLGLTGPWHVRSTNRLDAALDLLQDDAFDVVVLDLNLPDSSGLATVSRLAAQAPELAIVVSSGLPEKENAVEAVRRGAQDFLCKGSFDAQMLRRTLLLAIERTRGAVAVRARAETGGPDPMLARVAEAEARYRMLFDSNPQPLWVFDIETLRFLAVNEAACQQYGYTREEFLALTIADIRPPEDTGALLAQISGPTTGLRSAGTWRHRRKDGSLLDVEVHSHRLTFGAHAARLVLVQDITERRKFEERARQQQKMEAIGRLAGGVAHDFNNVLGVITGYAEVIRRGAGNSADAATERRAEQILKATESAARLTHQLLTFSRPRPPTATVLDLSVAVAELESFLRRLIGEHIQLVTVYDAKPVFAHMDSGQLEQILMNLAVNARDAMPSGGRLVIETASAAFDPSSPATDPHLKPGRYAVISVSDSGVGMSSQVVAHIFEPFFTTKGPGQGTGLGLATVYGIVQQAGGQIYVYSEAGHGSTFKVYLPSSAAAGAEEAEARATYPARGKGTEVVLVVEDDLSLQAILAEMLEDGGYRTMIAATPEEALRLAGESHVDLLLTDVVMPRIMGPALAVRIQASKPDIRVLFMSGYTGDSAGTSALDGISSGSLIEKPFTQDALLRAVRKRLT
jgi:two-component system cell cycle sensor histidine kinase/response regulator CckA